MEPPREDVHVGVEADQLLSPVRTNVSSVGFQQASIFDVSNSNVPASGNPVPLWLPFALRWYFVLIPAGFALICGLATMILHQQSQKHNGLGSEDSAMLGWKFIPTLIAVVYTQLTAMLLGAVKRTEPFARLAKSVDHIPVARFTLLEKSKPWWTTLAHGFQKRRNGGTWSWTAVLSCIAFILATLAISPLSAALLITKEIQTTTPMSLSRLALNRTLPIRPRAERSTYLRTMTALLQNYSASPWVMDDYFVLPFWPDQQPGPLWAPQSSTPQIWDAEATVLHTNFTCSTLETTTTDFFLQYTAQNGTCRGCKRSNITYFASALLDFVGGCKINVTVHNATTFGISQGFNEIISWSDIKHLNDDNIVDTDSLVSSNEECQMDELILMTTPWFTVPVEPDHVAANLTASAYACRSDHLMATIPVRASATSAGVSISFDKDEFHRSCGKVPSELIDTSVLHNIYTDPAWYELVPQPFFTDSDSVKLGGAIALLGTQYGFNLSRMMSESTIPETAARLRRRFFAEIMQTSLDTMSNPPVEALSGTRLAMERRIVVNLEVAATLCALLSLSFLILLAFLWLSRLSIRPLHLRRDPSSALGLCALVDMDNSILPTFKPLDLSSREDLKIELSDRVFATSPDALYELGGTAPLEQNELTSKVSSLSASILPALRIRNLLGLFAYILVLLIATVVLHQYARDYNLRQGLFTYRAKLKVLGDSASFSPFAVVPTLLAVGITLWWDSIDVACRTLQPYLAISRRPEPPSRGIALSYASSFWIWASAKAAKNRHWLLSLITLSTLWVQALTIAMSALFEQSSGIIPQVIDIHQSLEVRRDPFVQQTRMFFSNDTVASESAVITFDPNIVGKILAEAFTGLETNWMYTAMIQAAFNGPEPAWSKAGWSFVPVRLDDLSKTYITNNITGLQPSSDPELDALASITLQTAGVSARIECTGVQDLANTSMWLSHRVNDTTGGGYYNYPELTGLNELYSPDIIFFSGNESTRFVAQATIPQCCYNLTDPEGVSKHDMSVVVAYWTENWSSSSRNLGNFTVKWLQGTAGFAPVYNNNDPRMFFPAPPRLQALNCIPYIETAHAEVTLDPNSGNVHSYQILDEPLPDNVAWSDAFVLRNLSEAPRFRNSTERKQFSLDVTTSYGTMFMKSLLRAADLASLGSNLMLETRVLPTDGTTDRVFNMRDNATGLNLDFMSYAMYAQTNMDPVALLDAETLLREAQKVFSIFFQHFVSSNVSLETGGRAYQPVGSNLRVPPPRSTFPALLSDGETISTFEGMPLRNTNQTVSTTLNIRKDILQMNRVAFWMSVSIMVWLLVTLIVCMVLQRRYYGRLMRNVECMADVLVLVAGSERLLAIIKEKGINRVIEEDNIRTRLGWFRDPDGTMRWRIEMVEDAQIQLQPRTPGTAYAPVPADDEEIEDGASSPRASVTEQVQAQPHVSADDDEDVRSVEPAPSVEVLPPARPAQI